MSALLVMVEAACGEECDRHLQNIAGALREQPGGLALVVVITGPATTADIDRLFDVVPSSIGPLVDADGRVAAALEADRIPVTALIGADGEIHTLVDGYLGETLAAAIVAEGS